MKLGVPKTDYYGGVPKRGLELDEGAGGEVLELDAEGGTSGFEPADAESPAEVGEDGIVDGDDHFGVDFGDVFD